MCITMTKNMEELINKVSKGCNQYRVIRDLLQYGHTSELGYYMASQKYYTNYVTSFFNAVNRLEKHGIKVNYIPGQRGGYWTGYFQLV